eukprot:scaffold2835_cov105-Isochrysis_galbana.AAC.16
MQTDSRYSAVSAQLRSASAPARAGGDEHTALAPRRVVQTSCGLLGTEGGGVLEQAEPRGGGVGLPRLGRPRALPRQEAALRVRHHGEVPSVGRAERRDAVGGAVGVVRVGLGDGDVVVHIPEGGQLSVEHCLERAGLREVRTAFSVGHPHAERRALHPAEENGGRRLDLNRRPSRLEPARGVVDEARLLDVAQRRLGGGHPTEQSHQLAAVAHAQREGVGAIAEGVELRSRRAREQDEGVGKGAG